MAANTSSRSAAYESIWRASPWFVGAIPKLRMPATRQKRNAGQFFLTFVSVGRNRQVMALDPAPIIQNAKKPMV